MMIEARVHLPTPPGEARTEFLEMLAEVLVRANHEWATREQAEAEHRRAMGFEASDPKCCIACIRPRIRYVPPPGAAAGQSCQNFWCAPAMIKRGRANCLDAACYDAAMARFEGKTAHVEFESVGPLDYHAVAIVDGKRVDSAQKLIDGMEKQKWEQG